MAKKEKNLRKNLRKKIRNTHKKSRAKKKPQDKKSRDYIAISATPIIFLRKKYQTFFIL